MYVVEQTEAFRDWLANLKDREGRGRILARITSAQHGNFGDCTAVGRGVFEMRIHSGPGYRVYFTRTGARVYLLLCGGAKATQKRDIKQAIALADTIKGR